MVRIKLRRCDYSFRKTCKDSKFTTIHIEEFVINVRDTKLGPGVTTHDIPNVGEGRLKNLDVMVSFEWVLRFDLEISLLEKLLKDRNSTYSRRTTLRSIFGEKSRDVKDTSKRLENGKKRTSYWYQDFLTRKR